MADRNRSPDVGRGRDLLLDPRELPPDAYDATTRTLLERTVGFFETKGLARIKADDHERVWYSDFLELVAREKLFATFLTPPELGGPDCRWDTWRNSALNEILAFYGLAYWYTWQVTILGLGPIWMSSNEALRRRAAGLLDQGGVFAFGLSERDHGADLYSSEMTLHRQSDGTYRAVGEKYYIGNGNEAALVSVFGKLADSGDFVFFVVDPRHERYECLANVCNSQNYVAHFALHDYPITEAEILSRGQEAWDAALNTVNVGKFNLGWASIGICTHALYEAIDHASARRLFDHQVTDFPHIRQFFVDAYCRLVAMKLFALRGSDYLRTASAGDRRYLLYDPLVKMKVTMQGEEVMNLLWDVIAARGFEKDVYFEMAVRDIRALPKLEGTAHVNMALVMKFMKSFFFEPEAFPEIPLVTGPAHDEFLFAQGPTKGLGRIHFHDYRAVYGRFSFPNLRIFQSQVRAFRRLLVFARPERSQAEDIDFLLVLGELFTLVVYAQLVLESAPLHGTDDDTLEQIFDVLVRDVSRYAMQLFSKSATTARQRFFCRRMFRHPAVDPARFDRVWTTRVVPLAGAYRMSP